VRPAERLTRPTCKGSVAAPFLKIRGGCVRADLIGEVAFQIVAHAPPAGVFNLLESQRGADASARWRDIAQCDAGILPCQQPPRKGSPAQQDE
jgi:hypothetical protein